MFFCRGKKSIRPLKKKNNERRRKRSNGRRRDLDDHNWFAVAAWTCFDFDRIGVSGAKESD
jgi:hypothetical protein